MTTDKTYYTISIPDLYINPYTVQSVILNNKTYYFEYFWNNRHEKCYISIYILEDNLKIYLIRNKLLTLFCNISSQIFDYSRWSGDLYFKQIDLNNLFDYNQQNISTNYELSYVPV